MPTFNFLDVVQKTAMTTGLLFALIFFQPIHASNELPETVTVYLDINFASKKKRGAKKITESHIEYQQLGYRFVDLELYVENGDLRGFFITYTKD